MQNYNIFPITPNKIEFIFWHPCIFLFSTLFHDAKKRQPAIIFKKQQDTGRISSHRNDTANGSTIHQPNLPANAVPDSFVSRPRFGRVTPQIRSRLVPDSLPNTGSLTEIIGLGPEMVIPPSLPSIVRNTDWSILWNKNDWILHNFERHFSDITNRHSFPFNTDCLPEYQTSPLTNLPPEQSSQKASQQVINTNKKRTLDCSNVLFWGTQQIRTAVHGFADRYLATRSGYRCCLFASAKLKLYFHSTKLFGKKYLFLSKIWQTHIVKNHYFSYL